MLEARSAPSIQINGLEDMITPKQLMVLAAPSVAAGFFLAQPACALTTIAHPYLVESWEDVDVVQPIAQRRCYTYRDGRRVYRPCAPRGYQKPKRKSRSYGTTKRSGYDKPWGGYEPCANCPTAR
jgi:hypothetical protein